MHSVLNILFSMLLRLYTWLDKKERANYSQYEHMMIHDLRVKTNEMNINLSRSYICTAEGICINEKETHSFTIYSIKNQQRLTSVI